MNHLIIFLRSQLLMDFLRFESFHAAQDIGGTIDESFGDFFSIRVQAGDRVPGFKLPRDAGDAGSEQALAPFGQRLHGARVEVNLSARPEGKRNPVFATVQPPFPRKKETSS